MIRIFRRYTAAVGFAFLFYCSWLLPDTTSNVLGWNDGYQILFLFVTAVLCITYLVQGIKEQWKM